MTVRATLSELMKPEEISISHEMIDFQRNDYIVNVLEEYFNAIITEVKSNKRLKNAVDIQKNTVVHDFLNKIDFAIEERFGICVKHVAYPDVGYAVFTTPVTDVIAIHQEDNKDFFEWLKWMNKEYKTSKDKKQVDVLNPNNMEDKDGITFCKGVHNAITSLRATLKSDSVIVDRKRAKLIGLPKEHICYIAHDLWMLIKAFDLTGKELTAVILHEIGHAFTHIEYMYRSVTNVSVLMDTFLDNLQRKNKTPKESLILAFEKVTKTKDKDLRKQDAVPATIYVLDTFLKENRYDVTDSYYASIDSEQLADQFSGRFGMGPELVTALSKFKNAPYIAAKIKATLTPDGSNIFIIVLKAIFGIALVVLLAPYLILTVIIDAIITFLFGLSNKHDNFPGELNTYDNLRRRYVRVRNESIRAIRSLDLDKASIEKYLKSIYTIDKVIDELGEEKVGVFDAILRKLHGPTKRLLEIRTIEQLVEDLTENDLYVASAKLSTKIS